MNCENILCIYQSNNKCILDSISVDSLGMCTECIYPNIDQEILDHAKITLLRQYKNPTGYKKRSPLIE